MPIGQLRQKVAALNAIVNNHVGTFYLIQDRQNGDRYGLIFVRGVQASDDTTGRVFFQKTLPQGAELVCDDLTDANFQTIVDAFAGQGWKFI